MAETLTEKQARFAVMIAKLIDHIHNEMPGHRVRFGDAYRDPRAFGQMGADGPYGSAVSCHKLRLAVDLILDKWDGSRWQYQIESRAYEEIGLVWEAMGGTWGGRFEDGNHFSLEHEGRR